MRAILADVMSVGILVFTIGIGMFWIYHSEAKAAAFLEAGSRTNATSP